jgi:hypothetical protein
MAVMMLIPLRLLPHRMADMEDRTKGSTAMTTAGRGRTSNEHTGNNAGGNGRIGTAKMLPLGLSRLFHPLPLGLPRRLRLTCDGKTSGPEWGSRACDSHAFPHDSAMTAVAEDHQRRRASLSTCDDGQESATCHQR